MNSPRIHGLVAGIAGAITVALAYAVAMPPYDPPPPPRTPRAALSDEPIDLWMKLMPVFGHPRCVNCHGGVDPFNEFAGPPAIEHEAGVIGDPALSPGDRIEDCRDCHNETQEIEDAWVLAHFVDPTTDFFGKTALQICQKQSHEVTHRRNAPRNWITHLRIDALIRQSFGGRVGGQRAPPDPPPMGHPAFMEAAQKWLDVGAVCGRWEGQISQKEALSTTYTYPIEGNLGTNAVSESANREILIDRSRGMTQATASMRGIGSVVQTMNLSGPGGACTSVTTATTNWHSLPMTGTDVSVRVLIHDDGSYEIRFALPEEKTRASTSSVNRNDCGIPLPPAAQEPPIELEWPKWSFTIRCPSQGVSCTRFDREHPALKGSVTRTIVGQVDAVDPQSWLNVSPAGTSRADDGSPLPITVKTEWDFKLVP